MQALETIHTFDEVRKALRFKHNRTVKAVCERHKVPILNISPARMALRHADYELLLSRAAGEDADAD